jgi:hypothetical protein
MPLALESPGRVDRLRPIQSRQAFAYCLIPFARLEETQVFYVEDLGYGEAVMDLRNLYVFGLESREPVSFLRSVSGGFEISQVFLGM